MKRVIASIAVSLTSLACLFGLVVRQTDAGTRSVANKDAQQETAEHESVSTSQPRTIVNHERDNALLDYLKLPPRQRVEIWKTGEQKNGPSQRDKDSALVASGVDAVPYLAEIVHTGDFYHRIYALKILCDMDRFVPMQELPVPEVGAFIYVQPLRLGGRLNQFMVVDGRRIGKEGHEVVKWAAEQTKDKELRFHARDYSGLLQEDLRQLSLNDQLKQWREAVVKSKGLLGVNRDALVVMNHLGEVLVAQAPESIPPLINILDNDSSGYVREEALSLLNVIDSGRMRLRATQIGRKAIETIHQALERGGLQPVLEKKEWREKVWQRIYAEVFNDEVAIHHGSTWSVVAMAFEKFYGVKVTRDLYGDGQIVEAIPEFRQFVIYLTQIDPYFPGWEYSFTRLLPADQVLHPRFKQKIARYYEEWKNFKAQQGSSTSK